MDKLRAHTVETYEKKTPSSEKGEACKAEGVKEIHIRWHHAKKRGKIIWGSPHDPVERA